MRPGRGGGVTTAGHVGVAFGLTLAAGLATGLGSAIAFFAKRTNLRLLSVATGFSAGVMLWVSFLEILPKSQAALTAAVGARQGAWLSVGSFFLGILLILAIDQLVPGDENPHEVRTALELASLGDAMALPAAAKLRRTGTAVAVAIAIHNFPEGMATFLSALDDPKVGLAIAIAVALHNIPEGVSVAVPIYYATGRRRAAFGWSFLSGLAEPVGAAVGYLVLRPFLTSGVMGVVFGAVAGIMVFISLDELLPTSRAFGQGHDSLYGLLLGMGAMSVSLLLLMP
ncbi:MAG: zinc transporter ZupT [Thermoanaerobaculia bacterium]